MWLNAVPSLCCACSTVNLSDLFLTQDKGGDVSLPGAPTPKSEPTDCAFPVPDVHLHDSPPDLRVRCRWWHS